MFCHYFHAAQNRNRDTTAERLELSIATDTPQWILLAKIITRHLFHSPVVSKGHYSGWLTNILLHLLLLRPLFLLIFLLISLFKKSKLFVLPLLLLIQLKSYLLEFHFLYLASLLLHR